MKSWILYATLTVLPFPGVKAEQASPSPTSARPREERAISKLPSAVTYHELSDQKHEYRISGIYSASEKNADIDDITSTYRTLVPGSLGFQLDFKQHTATFQTSRELTLPELTKAIDEVAEVGGDLPYWAELEARDIEASKLSTSQHYSISATQEAPPAKLAWFALPKSSPFRMPLNLGGPDTGTLLIVPSTALCMCHSRFNLRILDLEGRLIWKDETTAFGVVKIALSEADERHQIWIRRRDHGGGEESTFLIHGHSTNP